MMNKFKRLLPVAAIGLLLITLVGCGQPLGEIFDPAGNPFGHRFSDMKDIRAATFVVAASDSEHKYDTDFRCDSTDDHVQIQAALDALPATGGEVRLLDGRFNIEVALVLDSYQTLRGCGRNTILTTTTANLDIITATGGSGTEKVGILIADFCIDGKAGGATNDIGILWTYVDYSKITNMWFQDNSESEVQLDTSDFNEIAVNICQSDVACGIHLIDSDNNTVMGNACQGNFHHSGVYLLNSDNNTVTGNICQGYNWGGIRISSSDYNTVIDNICRGSDDHGIDVLDSDNNIIIGNISLESSQGMDNIYSNIHLSGSSYNLVASNLCRQGALANQPKYGIRLFNDTCVKNVIQGNDLHDAGKTANFDDRGTLTIVQDDNRGIEITQVRHYVYIKNTSGGALAAGDVVRLKAVAAGNEITTTAVLGDDMVYGMVAEVIADNASGYVLVKGKTIVLSASNDHGNIVIGDPLCANDTATEACLAGAGDMGFAIALEVCAAANCAIDAYIISPWD
jgi:parallel beta-helix repeat protein